MEDFRDYLEAVCQVPRLRGTCSTYVETEVADRQRLPQLEEVFDPFGDFAMDLMVQNVVLEEKPEQNFEKNPELGEKSREKPKEMIERLPVLTGICKYAVDHVLLVGRPGSGKTTALERLLVQEAEAAIEDSTARIPVLIRLRDLTKSTVLEQMQQELQVHGLRLAIDRIADLLWAGRFLVLLDGVNELPSGEKRQEVESFRRSHQRTTSMIFTTRELNVGLDLGIEKKLEMQPLNERQMQEFTCRYLGREQGQQLIKGLGLRLREFGQTPLLLWMLCGVFRAVGEIPTNLGGVFRGFANIYNKNRFDSQKSSEYSRFLQQLAWAMMPKDSPLGLRLSIPRSEAEEIFREFRKAEQEGNALSGAIATLDELLRFHLLRLKDDREVEFSHQLFQEYYAGEYLLSRLPGLTDLELQKCYLNYLDWTEALALMAGLVGDREQALRLVRLGLEVDLMLGARLAGEVLPQFQEETVGLVTNWDLPLWLKVELWGKTKSDKAVDSLTHTLQNEYVRWESAKTLGNIGSKRAVDSLIQALQDQDSNVRERALYALGKVVSKQAVGSLIQALQDQGLNVDKRALLYALGNIGCDQAVNALIKSLQDHNSCIRIEAAESLGKIGSNWAVNSLIKSLQDHNSSVRRCAARALGNIGSDQAVIFLIKSLQDHDSFVRSYAAEALGNIGSDQAVNFLIKSLQDHDSFVRSYAARALGNIGSDRAINVLIQVLQDQNSSVRENVAEALKKISFNQVVDFLIKALQDQDWAVRKNVAEALGNIGSDRAMDALIQALQDQNKNVCGKAAEALGKIGSNKFVNALIKTLQDQDGYVRRYVVEALGKIGSDKAVDRLIFCLQDEDFNLRIRAAEALGKTGSDKAVNALIKALQDRDDYVCRKAVEALGNIGSDKAVDPLISYLQDEDFNLRVEAAKALGKIGLDQSVYALIKALQDKDSDVRVEVAEALGKFGKDKLISQLWQIYQSGKKEVIDAISEIQERYRLYNYEISQTPLPAITPTPSPVTYNIAQAGQIIQNQNIAGNNTGIQNL